MNNGWEFSAQAWIESMGERGDWAREHVLDPVMLGRIATGRFSSALDVGCGEGRFCRILKAAGVNATGIDPTPQLVETARRRDPSGDYRLGRAEELAFETADFDLVVSYLTLVDIADFRAAISEMARVLKPGGSLLIANLTGFTSACAAQGWVRDGEGRCLHFPIDHYLDEFPFWFEWAGIRIENWHRPLAAYMTALLESGLHLTFFSEPEPVSGEGSRRVDFRRVPWFVVMEWRRPTISSVADLSSLSEEIRGASRLIHRGTSSKCHRVDRVGHAVDSRRVAEQLETHSQVHRLGDRHDWRRVKRDQWSLVAARAPNALFRERTAEPHPP
jgi:SAM-dependent methyltransferase